jgi:integrase/recombinase XerD
MTLAHLEILPSRHKDLSTSINPSIDYDDAVAITKRVTWAKLKDRSVKEALEIWFTTLSPRTAINYCSGMQKLQEHGFIDLFLSLQAFALINHDAIIDRIKKEVITDEEWSECTRQARASCYISFTGFLSRRFQGMVKKAVPCKEGNGKTFFRVHDKVKSNAMTQSQWIAVLQELGKINSRDCLIAKMALQGGKRINEVLTLTTDRIAWDRGEITFLQSKTKGTHKETVITYPKSVIDELRLYIGSRSGVVFVTRTGKSVPMNQLAKTFYKAGVLAKIPFKVTPHVLRASTVTYLKQQGFSDSDIMRVTGHASAEMVYAYDKTARADNASKKVSLVS